MLPEVWEQASRWTRAVLWTQTTVLGRFLLGPALVVGQSLREEWTDYRGQRAAQLACWVPHLIGVALVLSWVSGVCGIPIWIYVLAWAYPGLGLTLLRSFNEHRADPDPALRTVLVERSRLLRWLYLNNDLHVLHHRYPQLPWYELPDARREEPDLPGYRQHSYLQVVWSHLIRPRGSPVYPLVESAAREEGA